MKICLGKELVEKVKKKDSENEKNLLKNRNSENVNELDENDIYIRRNTIKNIKLGTQVVYRIYLNHNIVYELDDTINLNLFHSLVPAATTTSIIFDSLENQNISNYNLVGYCDANSHIAVYQYNTEYLILNIRNAVNYAPFSCYNFFYNYKVLINCVLYNFNTNNVTNMSYMFNYCSSLTSLDLSSFNTNNVTNMSYMFNYCSSLTSLDLSSFNTNNVTNMSSIFNYCSSLTSLDLSSFNTNNVTNMSYMFSYCSSLTSLNVSGFNTNKVTNMFYLFFNCSSLTSLDVSNFNTNNVTNMGAMFSNCSSLTSLDVSNFKTNWVSNIGEMFNRCSKITSLDLSSFYTSRVTNMNLMFNYCSELRTIISNTFSQISLKSSYNMFFSTYKLFGGNGTKFSNSHSTADYARVDGENGLPGYFTAPANKNI